MSTEISTLGEFGLIDRLTREFPLVNPSSVLGVGDDAAIIAPEGDKEILVTTDLLLEGIHFDVRYVPLMHLGYKAAVVNFSDIYAMNGTPRQITVSIGVSSRFTVENIDAVYAGIRLACESYGVDLVGGDTSASVTGLVISVTCLGEVEKGKAVRRSGAKETDLICVSGDLGGAYMGLQLLERENYVAAQSHDPGFQPNFEGKEYILQRQLRPEARKDIVERLRAAGVTPTSMMDVSDGLSSELLHICKASGVGCRVYEDRVPIDYQTALMAEELNMNLVTAAMNGGEDYELLFTVPLADKEKVEHIDGVRMIGYVTAPSLGAALVSRDGSELPIRAQGWNAFTEKRQDTSDAAPVGDEPKSDK
ncbi:thiamine-phosphate kinase [uncultured Duncaniella sp.]|mgnify:FL=1|uniref:thiamine-phosphate kinase n=1 Tax=uncultured Duncaniella sp. TaxID=2768039 RepID=UPI002734F815|nr:thiamine-phosphate kinase [uncultured Duncaniella sp.]